MMENDKDFHHDDVLARAVNAVLRESIAAELPPERLARLTAVVRDAADQRYHTTLLERMKSMRPRTKIAVAAAVVIALLGLMPWLVPGGGPSMAFADMVEAVNSIHTATWKTARTNRAPGGKLQKSTGIGMFMAPDKVRTETEIRKGDTNQVASVQIFDGQQGKILTLNPMTKTAYLVDIEFSPEGPTSIPPPFVGFRQMIASAGKNGKSGGMERLGIETMGGRRAEVFRKRSESTQMKAVVEIKIWADPKTSLPIRIEESVRGKFESDRVMTDFQYDVDLDPALFRVDVPEGYTTQQTQLDFSKGPLGPLAEVLGLAAKHNGGVFPATLTGKKGIREVMERAACDLWKRFGIEIGKGGAPREEDLEKFRKLSKDDIEGLQRETSVLVTKLPAALASVAAIGHAKHGGWHYAGKDVKLGTSDRPIFWCKFKKNYQVIYADLSIKEVSPEDVPTLPESESSSTAQRAPSKPSP